MDAITGISVEDAPAANGPAFPALDGLAYLFGKEREWPSPVPVFYVSCSADADLSISGVLCEMTEQEIEDERLREKDSFAWRARVKRNMMLAGCDYTQLADAPVDSAAWAQYRQALRDVPSQDGFPLRIKWPEQPK